MYVVDGDSLECYGWKDGEKLIVLRDMTEEYGLPEKFFYVHNIDRNERSGVLESQIKEFKSV